MLYNTRIHRVSEAGVDWGSRETRRDHGRVIQREGAYDVQALGGAKAPIPVLELRRSAQTLQPSVPARGSPSPPSSTSRVRSIKSEYRRVAVMLQDPYGQQLRRYAWFLGWMGHGSTGCTDLMFSRCLSRNSRSSAAISPLRRSPPPRSTACAYLRPTMSLRSLVSGISCGASYQLYAGLVQVTKTFSAN